MIYFLSILDGEYVKIGFTGQPLRSRMAKLQTGNPHEIKVMFSIDGSLGQEKEIHKALNDVFDRIKVFSNPVNEWYLGNNPIVKMFVHHVKGSGIEYAINALKSIVRWEQTVNGNEVFSVRDLEKSLRKNGMSRNAAKHFIWERNNECIHSLLADPEKCDKEVSVTSHQVKRNYVLRKASACQQLS